MYIKCIADSKRNERAKLNEVRTKLQKEVLKTAAKLEKELSTTTAEASSAGGGGTDDAAV